MGTCVPDTGYTRNARGGCADGRSDALRFHALLTVTGDDVARSGRHSLQIILKITFQPCVTGVNSSLLRQLDHRVDLVEDRAHSRHGPQEKGRREARREEGARQEGPRQEGEALAAQASGL